MSSRLSTDGLCVLVAGLLGLLALAPASAGAAEGLGGLTLETSIGPVSCAPDPGQEPGPEDISTVTSGARLRVTILRTGALRCQTTLGEVEVSGANLPWRLTVNGATHTATLRGDRRLALQLQLVALPSVKCLYQAGRVSAGLLSEAPLSIAVSVPRIRLNKRASNALCPALGPIFVSLTLP